MAFSRERILDALARLPFIDAGELALILGEPLATAHRAMTALMKNGAAGRVSHGPAHLPTTTMSAMETSAYSVSLFPSAGS